MIPSTTLTATAGAVRAWLLVPCVLCLAVGLEAQGERSARRADRSILDLDVLLPEKGPFGPRAHGMAFSFDGRHAAYLYRTYRERRHGDDLWLVDVVRGRTRRLTSPAVMAAFQESARKVLAHRRRSAGGGFLGALFGGGVDAKDADAKNAPRYTGVGSFVWSPKAAELLFVSEGDVYRWRIGERAPVRLTATRATERDVRYLPDGSGCAFLRDGALVRLVFGSDFHEQLDPELGEGETMIGFRFSPDGRKLALLARKGRYSTRESRRKVAIARYRGRFMEVREVPRHVPDDPMPEVRLAYYLYVPGGRTAGAGRLVRVFEHTMTGPRDTYHVPEWSPDSQRVVFAIYRQKDAVVRILEAKLPPPKAAKNSEKSGTRSNTAAAEPKDAAQVVLRFLHTGGPTTPRMIHPRYLAGGRHVLYLSEQSGFRHLHVLDPLWGSQQQLTRGRFEVYPIDLSKDRKTVWVTATKEDPSRLEIYRVSVADGRMERISHEPGYYSDVAVSPDGGHALARYVRFGIPPELVWIDRKAPRQRTLTRSHPPIVRRLVAERPRFFTYRNRHGHEIHGHMFLPDDWSKQDQRPLLVYVYGGPLGTRKNVVEGAYHRDAYFFALYMAKKHGYVTCTIDPRGMSGYGALFEKANYEQVGRPQVEDLVDGVKFLVANYGVDPRRVGIHGWSFGGFQTQMCLYTQPDVFACGIAGAGPTEWQNYNSWYSTGTIGPSRTGKPDLERFSLLPLAKNLKGKLLLVHGMEDSNVLFQDTVRVYRELLRAGKETLVELFLDPTGGHGLGGDVKKAQRARKYEEFLVRVLGEGRPAARSRPESTAPGARETRDIGEAPARR